MRVTLAIALAAALASTQAPGQQTTAAPVQTVRRAGMVAAVPGSAAYFTGDVKIRALADPVAPGRTAFGEVTFAPGTRSHWHTHPAGQTLYVLEGCGLTQQDGHPATRICKGDTVYVPPGVRHWHGATATSAMVQLSATETVDGRNVDWEAPVTEADYAAANRVAR